MKHKRSKEADYPIKGGPNRKSEDVLAQGRADRTKYEDKVADTSHQGSGKKLGPSSK